MTERLHFHFSLSCIGEGNGNPLQCSCLENPRDGGAWWAAVYGVAQSRTRLKRLSSSSSSSSRYADDTTLMADSEEELKSLLMKVKKESEKAGLKLNIQKKTIMASGGPITSWEIDGETVETVSEFIFGGSKITADGDCSHEIKMLAPWKESLDKPAAAAAKLLQLCPSLCYPKDGSPLGSPIPGILQARTLEWVAISFSKA